MALQDKQEKEGGGLEGEEPVQLTFMFLSLLPSFFQTPAGLLCKAHNSHEASPSAVASSQCAVTRCAYVGCHGDISARLNGAACSGLGNGIGPGVFLKPSGKASHHEKRFLPWSTCLYFGTDSQMDNG